MRPGTKWSRFERNWIKWMTWKETRKEQCFVNPHFVFHSLNAPFFDETLRWSNIELKNWSWDFLVNPEHLNMSYLPDAIKEYILACLDNLVSFIIIYRGVSADLLNTENIALDDDEEIL